MGVMTHTMTFVTQVGPDHRVTIELPAGIPEGEVKLTCLFEVLDDVSKKLSPQEFLRSEFFGMWADRDDLPSTNEEFIAWRRGLQERPQD